jgi:hypothetical protein
VLESGLRQRAVRPIRALPFPFFESFGIMQAQVHVHDFGTVRMQQRAESSAHAGRVEHDGFVDGSREHEARVHLRKNALALAPLIV